MTQKKANTVLGILLLTFCLIGSIWGILRKNTLEQNYKLTIAKPISFTAGGRGNAGGIWIDYLLDINGKQYKGSSRYLTNEITTENLRNFILFKTFPAAYSPSNPSNSSILITPRNFTNYGYTFPDSLTWVLQYFQ